MRAGHVLCVSMGLCPVAIALIALEPAASLEIPATAFLQCAGDGSPPWFGRPVWYAAKALANSLMHWCPAWLWTSCLRRLGHGLGRPLCWGVLVIAGLLDFKPSASIRRVAANATRARSCNSPAKAQLAAFPLSPEATQAQIPAEQKAQRHDRSLALLDTRRDLY